MTRVSLVNAAVESSATAVVTATGSCTYGELRDRIAERSARSAEYPPGIVIVLMRNDMASIVDYLGVVESGRAAALVDPALPPESIEMLANAYGAAAVVGSSNDIPGFRRSGSDLVTTGAGTDVHPELGVMLATSGSTGSPKFVRLSWDAVLANASSIGVSLGVRTDDRAPLTLPLHYSYGLSVLNSHLHSGASVVPTDLSFVQREFWELFDSRGCTSLAGVPYSYQMLRRLRFAPGSHPTLRVMTQAGGRLADSLVAEFHELLAPDDIRFYVMYGQTEATARMAVLDPGDLPLALGSVGKAIPGGKFEIVDGEVVYEGPNVMMGYAERATDLALGDRLAGRLATGDLGEIDDHGFLRLTGRAKRIGKVFGTRVSLDDVEGIVSEVGPVATTSDGDKIVVFMETAGAGDGGRVARMLSERLRLPISGFDVRLVDELPRRTNGKIDYAALDSAT